MRGVSWRQTTRKKQDMLISFLLAQPSFNVPQFWVESCFFAISWLIGLSFFLDPTNGIWLSEDSASSSTQMIETKRPALVCRALVRALFSPMELQGKSTFLRGITRSGHKDGTLKVGRIDITSWKKVPFRLKGFTWTTSWMLKHVTQKCHGSDGESIGSN